MSDIIHSLYNEKKSMYSLIFVQTSKLSFKNFKYQDS